MKSTYKIRDILYSFVHTESFKIKCLADLEDRLVDTDGKGEDGTNGECSIDVYTLPCLKQAASGSSALSSVMTLEGGMGGQESCPRGRGYVYGYS